jgi:hypothetical protein
VRGLERKLGALCRAAAVYIANSKIQSNISQGGSKGSQKPSERNKYEPLEEHITTIKQVRESANLILITE